MTIIHNSLFLIIYNQKKEHQSIRNNNQVYIFLQLLQELEELKFYLLAYLRAWLLPCLLPSLLTFLIIINSIYKEILISVDCKFLQNHTQKIAEILLGDIPHYDLCYQMTEKGRKLNHTSWQAQTLIFRFHNENLCLVIFHTQININCKKCIKL